MNITIRDIRNLVTSTIYSRGLGYYRAGHVHLVTIEDDYFFAEVSGTYDYEVRVNSKGHVYHVECNCPYWDNCKHIVAAMLEAKDYYDSKNNYLGQNKQTSWQQYFEKAILKSKYAEAESKKWQLLYCIDFKKHYWTILPRKAYVKRDGSFGRLAKISQWDINNEEVQFTSSDALILTHLEKVRVNSGSYFYYEDHLSVSTQIEYGAKLGKLIDLLHQSRLYLSKNDSIGNPITFDTKSVSIEFRITEIENGITMTPYVKLRGKWIALNNEFHVLSEDPIWLFYNKEIFKVKNLKNPAYLTPYTYKTNYVIFIPTNDVPEFFNDVLPRLDIVDRIVFSDQLIDATISEFSGKRIYLEQLDDDLIIHPKFMYGTIEVSGPSSSKTYFTIHPDKNSYVKIIRNQAAEEKVLETLILSGVNVNSDGSYRVALKNALDWLIEGVAVLLSNGFEIYGEDSLKLPPIKRGNPRISVAVNSGIDWFDLKLEIDIDNTSLSIAEIRSALRKNERFVKLADGSVAKLPDKWLRKFRHLINLAKGKNDELYFTHYHTTLIDELFKDVEEKQYSNSFKQELKKFNNFGHTTPKNVPLSFQGSLRSYQKTGYDWLLSLKELKFGGCLADDMGLGKTIQTLVLLLNEYENGATAPSLIIAPVSIIFNWELEVKKFAPSLRVLNHTGLERNKSTDKFRNYDLILTSYGTGRRDVRFLKDFLFHYVILDESQKIKNPESQTAKAIRLLKADHRLVLTGTPVENSTIELWSQFSFLNPGYLGSLNFFKDAFAKPIERDNNKETAELLQRITNPFILRRTKENVAKELPPKIESTIYCDMTSSQKKLYQEWRESYRSKIVTQIDQNGIEKSRIQILAALAMLRQIACHPRTVKPNYHDNGGKFETFFGMIEEILARKHKILVFSQFVKILKLLREKLDDLNILYQYLDGTTRDRESPVKKFQNDKDYGLFLISLRAGGTGLNLTAADYVIHYDPWWNPAVEVQATDRTHRIGQDKHVFVYKLISRDSIEEKILELQGRKKELVSNIITTDTGMFKTLDRNEIINLFS